LRKCSKTRQPDTKASVLDLVEAELICRYADERGLGPGAKMQSDEVYLDRGENRPQPFPTIPATDCPWIEGKTPITDP
jgi:hypothetical protein